MESKTSDGAKKYSFGQALSTFIDHIESLANSLPVVLGTIDSAKGRASKLHNEFLEKDCERREEDGRAYYIVKPEFVRRNKLLRKEVVQSSISYKIIQRNYVVSLISQFDSFMGSLIRTMFYYRPELLNSSEKQISFTQLLDFVTVENAREYIIEKEIESVLRESHANHFKWLEDKLRIELRKDLPIWSTFIELTERRNLYVHTNGMVSSQYLKVCRDHGVTIPTDVKIGAELHVDDKYFETAFQCVFELAVKLSQVTWRQLSPKDLTDADTSILNLTYELIQSKQYALARVLLDFCDKYIKKYSSDDLKLRIIINRAQTYKWLGDESGCAEIIGSRDWSATGEVFRLAVAVLSDKKEEALAIMRAMGSSNMHISKNSYREWPIFQNLRKEDAFLDCFMEVFGEPFEIKERYSAAGFKIINEETFTEHFNTCLKIASAKPDGFVGAKFLVETYLGQKGFDTAATWILYEKLTEAGKLESYMHVDPAGIFPPVKAVKWKI